MRGAMTFEEIEAIVRRLDDAGVDAADIRVGSARLRLRFSATAPAAPPERRRLAAPAPGRFCPLHPLDDTPRFADGDAVPAGEVVAYVEASGLLRPVTAPTDIILGRCLVEPGAAVGWGTPLYELR